MSILENFEVCKTNVDKKEPYIRITPSVLTINKSVLDILGDPEYILLLLNKETLQFAIQKCTETKDGAMKITKIPNRVQTKRINDVSLCNNIYDLTGWSRLVSSYQVFGEYIPEENVVIFDLNGDEAEK